MTWTKAQLDQLGNAREIDVTSRRPDGSLRPWTKIWVVRVGEDLFVRSVRGAAGGWYRRAMQHRRARVRAGDVETDVTLEPVTESGVEDDVAAAYPAKYGQRSQSVQAMLADVAASTTVRLVPV